MPPYVVFVIYFNDISDFFSLAKSLNKGERKGSQFQKYQKFSFSSAHTLDIVTVHVIFKLHQVNPPCCLCRFWPSYFTNDIFQFISIPTRD